MPSVAGSNNTLPPDAFASVAPMWCDLGCCSRTDVVIKAVANPPALSTAYCA